MTIYFVDGTNGSDSNNGQTMDTAWATIEHAIETSGLAAGDVIFVRRGHSEMPTSDITINSANDGSLTNPIKLYGWPRAAHVISSSDWTQGSNTVTIDDNNMTRLRHQGRFVTGPDGNDYLITRVISSSSINIDRPYPGTTVTNQPVTIKADEWWYDDMGSAYGFDDSTWTIKENDWDADVDDLPEIDGAGGDYCFDNAGGSYWEIAGLSFKDLADATYGLFFARNFLQLVIRGCLFKQSYNEAVLYHGYSTSYICIIRSTLEGDGDSAKNAQYGLNTYSGEFMILKDVAIYNVGDFGLRSFGICVASNVNIGVEQSNGDADINGAAGGILIGRDIKLGGTNGYYEIYVGYSLNANAGMHIENYGKELGVHISFANRFEIKKVPVIAGSGDPQKRTDGADAVVGITPFYSYAQRSDDFPTTVLDHILSNDGTSKTYRYYVQLDAASGLGSTEVWLEAEYIKDYNTDTSYYTGTVKSSQTISVRSGASDWSQYLEVTVAPDTASDIRLRIKCNWYELGAKLYIDPKVEIS